MVIHNVYFWLKNEVTEDQKNAFEQGMRDLAASVQEIHQAYFGVPATTPSRDVVDHSFGFSLFLWFENVEDHNIYQDHPAHHKFVEDFKDLWAEVQVKDSSLL